jgi:hypothetical protein
MAAEPVLVVIGFSPAPISSGTSHKFKKFQRYAVGEEEALKLSYKSQRAELLYSGLTAEVEQPLTPLLAHLQNMTTL